MLQHLLWSEIALKGLTGLVLVIAPGHAAAMLGQPTAATGFWPRVLGSLLLGTAGSLLLHMQRPLIETITPVGLIAINLSGALVLIAHLVLQTASQTRRGTVLLWIIALNLLILSLVEISFM
jgi:hypothetical protein